MNGTHRDTLKSALIEAADKLAEAGRALRECAPNGRDYYPQDAQAMAGNSIRQATKEHLARIQAITQVSNDLESIMQAIDEQTGGPR